MHTITGQHIETGLVRVRGSWWARAGRYPLDLFTVDYRLAHVPQNHRGWLRIIAQDALDVLDRMDEFE